jgi:hypothetical protein
VRQQVRGELDALELEPERARERLRDQRLAQPGQVLEQEMAVRDETGQDLIDRPVPPDDGDADGAADLLRRRFRLARVQRRPLPRDGAASRYKGGPAAGAGVPRP